MSVFSVSKKCYVIYMKDRYQMENFLEERVIELNKLDVNELFTTVLF